MRTIEVAEEIWDLLLAARDGDPSDLDLTNPAIALYGPIVSNPFLVMAQVGQSLDGRIATPKGDARDVSGPDGLAHLHRCRALVDAVIVGVGTVTADDPRLSVRMAKGSDPVRVVIDCRAELTGEEGIFCDGGAPVILFQSTEAPEKKYPGVEVIRLKPRANGIDPYEILAALEERSLTRILVEGGARTIARFMDADLIDRLHVAVSPIIIGSGPSGISLPPIERLSSAYRPTTEIYSLGSDVLFDCALAPAQHPSARQSKKIRVRDLA